MFVPNIKTFRQVTLAFFILTSTSASANSSLYDELDFLKKASNKVEVYLPPGKRLQNDPEEAYVEDSLSTSQAGIQKNEVKSDSYDAPPQRTKKLRFRSR